MRIEVELLVTRMSGVIIVCLLAISVTTKGNSLAQKNVIRKYLTNDQKEKQYFENRLLKEFDDTRIPIFPKDEEILEAIVKIEDKNLITLRNLKLAKEPEFEIASLDSSLKYFSMRVKIEARDLAFSGKIYVNEDTEPAGDVRYTLRNVKGFGLVGLGVTSDGKFVSTNYFMEYDYDDPEFLSSWTEGTSNEREIENELEEGARNAMDTLLKKRFDSALAKISVNEIFGVRRSGVDEIKKRFRSYYDKIIDSLIKNLNKRMEENNIDEVKLPDLDMPLSYGVFGLNVNGQVLASEGWLRNLATFVRRGPMSASFESGNFIIFGNLGMTELRFGYDSCTIKIAGIGPRGNLSGTFENNNVELAVSVNVGEKSISIANFDIKELSDFDIEFTGLGPFNWLSSRIAGWIMNGIKQSFMPTIVSLIREQIEKELADLDVEELIENTIF